MINFVSKLKESLPPRFKLARSVNPETGRIPCSLPLSSMIDGSVLPLCYYDSLNSVGSRPKVPLPSAKLLSVLRVSVPRFVMSKAWIRISLRVVSCVVLR